MAANIHFFHKRDWLFLWDCAPAPLWVASIRSFAASWWRGGISLRERVEGRAAYHKCVSTPWAARYGAFMRRTETLQHATPAPVEP